MHICSLTYMCTWCHTETGLVHKKVKAYTHFIHAYKNFILYACIKKNEKICVKIQ